MGVSQATIHYPTSLKIWIYMIIKTNKMRPCSIIFTKGETLLSCLRGNYSNPVSKIHICKSTEISKLNVILLKIINE